MFFVHYGQRGDSYSLHLPFLRPSGVSKAADWAFQRLPMLNRKPAQSQFMSWRDEEQPRPKNELVRPSNWDDDTERDDGKSMTVLKIVTGG